MTRTGKLNKGEATAARIRAAASKVFALRGYHQTKVSDIVAEAGVSQPTFYSYFASKESAYEDLVAEFRARLETLTLSLLIDGGTPRGQVVEQVAVSFQRALDFLADDQHLTEIGFFQPPSCSETKASFANWIARNIAQEQASGLFRADIPAAQLGACFVGLLDQMTRMQGNEEERRALANGCAKLLCEGIWQGVRG